MNDIILEPLIEMQNWINKEKELGSQHPGRIVLASATSGGAAHSRVVAIKKITDTGVVFMTQKGTRKTDELKQNPHASMTLWLPLQQRQVIIEGMAQPLTHEEVASYWKITSKEQQLRFTVYSPISGRTIDSISSLEEEYKRLVEKYKDSPVPLSEFYCGYHINAETMYFYTLGDESFSQVERLDWNGSQWQKKTLSP